MAPYIADEYRPGFGIESEDEVLAFIREHASTIFHPVGTCRMGPDEDSVVDTRLRVRGVQGLRVIDASIMPLLVSGNTNAGSIAIGEKGADLILKDERTGPEHLTTAATPAKPVRSLLSESPV